MPADTGVQFLLSGNDTVGVLTVNLDARESRLAPATDRQLRELWQGVRIVDLERAPAQAFANAARGDLTSAFLWLALLLGISEIGLASWWKRA